MGGFQQAALNVIKSPGLREGAEEILESGIRRYMTSGESYLSRFTGDSLKNKGVSGKWLAEEAFPLYSKLLRSDTEVLLSNDAGYQNILKQIKNPALTKTQQAGFAQLGVDTIKVAKKISTDSVGNYVFGPKRTRLVQAISNIGIESNSHIVKQNAADIASIYLREEGFQKWREQVGGIKAQSPYVASSSFERMAKNVLGYSYLGKLVVPHLGQPIYTLLNNGAEAWLRSFAEVASDPKAALEWTRRSGALFEESYRAMQDISAGRDTIYHKFLHMPFFTQVRQWQVVHAAIAGKYLAEDAAEKLVRTQNPGSAAHLRMLGLNPNKIIQQGGKLTAEDYETAAYRSADESFFIDQGLKTPAAWHKSSLSRGIFLYKNFAFRAGKMIKDSLMRDAKAGNMGGVLRKLTVLTTAFPAAGYMINGVSNLASGRPWNDRTGTLNLTGDELTDDIINMYAHTGALGIGYSLLRGMAYNRTSDWIAGPALGVPADILTSIDALRKGEYKRPIKKLVQKIPVVGSAVASNLDKIEDWTN